MRVGKQSRGRVLGFVDLLGVLVNKFGEDVTLHNAQSQKIAFCAVGISFTSAIL